MRIDDFLNAFFKLDTNMYLFYKTWMETRNLYVQRFFSITHLLLKALLLCNWLISERNDDRWKIDIKWTNIYLEIGQYASKVTYFIHYWGQMRVEKIYMTKEPWQHSKIQKQDFYDEVRSNCNSN